jgi:hypothetical protein
LTPPIVLTILPRVSQTTSMRTCTRCGLPLRAGVCPNGHPQRAARGRRRRWPRLLRIASVPILVAVLVYGGLFWYPVRAAKSLIVPSSEEFEKARTAYEATTGAFPNSPDPATLVQQAAAVLASADAARQAITDAETRLEARSPVSIPVLDRRPPLPLAHDVRERMLSFYLGALELVADMEGVARYLTEVAAVLPKMEDLRGALGNPRTPAEVDAVIPAARAVADQILADLDALAPPVEIGSLHEALRAIVATTRGHLDELDAVRGRAARPILSTLVTEIGAQLDTFRETFIGGPGAALEAGLAPRMAELTGQIQRILEGLARLRDEHGLDDVVVPAASP